MEDRIVKLLDYEPFQVTLTVNNLVCVRMKTDEPLEVELVKDIIDAVDKIRDGAKVVILVLVSDWIIPTMEARDFLAKRTNPDKKAEAYVVKSLSQKLIGNVYLSFNKPNYPTRIFTDKELAIAWLKTKL